MEIPQDAIYRGTFTVYLDTPMELEKAVKEYNKVTGINRCIMKRVREIKEGFLILNLVSALAIIVIGIFENLLVSAATFVLCAAVYVFGIKKGYLIIVPIVNLSIVLLYWQPAVILILFDAGLLLWYYKNLEPIKNAPGYPEFRTIDLVYERRNQPQAIDKKEKR